VTTEGAYALWGVIIGGGITGGIALVSNRAVWKEAARTRAHEREMASDARLWQEKAATYLRLLQDLDRMDATSQVSPSLDSPDSPSGDELRATGARVVAFGSEAVRALVDGPWMAAVREIWDAAGTLLEMDPWSATEQEEASLEKKFSATRLQTQARVEKARIELREAARLIQRQIAAELQGRQPLPERRG
jgi:hypothetical protein